MIEHQPDAFSLMFLQSIQARRGAVLRMTAKTSYRCCKSFRLPSSHRADELKLVLLPQHHIGNYLIIYLNSTKLLDSPKNRYLQQFPIDQLQDYTDWINLMTYVSLLLSDIYQIKILMLLPLQDIHGSWDIKFNTGVLPHTAIPEVNSAVNMLLKAGVKMGKINLGIG